MAFIDGKVYFGCVSPSVLPLHCFEALASSLKAAKASDKIYKVVLPRNMLGPEHAPIVMARMSECFDLCSFVHSRQVAPASRLPWERLLGAKVRVVVGF